MAARPPHNASEPPRAARPTASDDAARNAEIDRDLDRGLAGYLAAVAASLGITVEATASEVSDTATAYLALAAHAPRHPGRDLMLIWSELHGWRLAVETDLTEGALLLGHLSGGPVPAPAAVARFVRTVLDGTADDGPPPPEPVIPDRAALSRRLLRYTSETGLQPPGARDSVRSADQG